MRQAFRSFGGWFWRWDVTAIGSPLIYGLGFGAMTADQYVIASVLYFIAVLWLTVRLLVWEETKQHSQRGALSVIVILVAAVAFGASLLWVKHTHAAVAHNQQASASLPPKADAQVDVDKLAASLAKKYPPQVINRDHTIAQEAAGASDSATVRKNPLKHPTPVTSTGPNAKEIAEELAKLQGPGRAAVSGNLKARALAFSQEIKEGLRYRRDSIARHSVAPNTAEERLSIFRNESDWFRWKYLEKIRALRDEFADVHIRNNDLDEFFKYEDAQAADRKIEAEHGVTKRRPDSILTDYNFDKIIGGLVSMADQVRD
jgi:hypothetical protein